MFKVLFNENFIRNNIKTPGILFLALFLQFNTIYLKFVGCYFALEYGLFIELELYVPKQFKVNT